jgi:hypothetical protein
MSPKERPLLEEVLDYALYAPVGLLLSVTEDLPELVRKGRSRIEGQLTVARFVGRVAANRARRQLEDLLETHPEPPRPRVVETEVIVTRPAPPSSERDVAASELAIPDYDTLAASQVVARLSALSRAELGDVRRHEQANRRRRTILNRITQLEQAGDAGS